MATGRVNLWIPDAFKSNCAIDNTFTFVATVQHCDGSVLEWSGGRYQTKDGAWHQIVGDPNGLKPGASGYYDGVPGTGDPGHVTFEAPPGCYLVSASVHVWIQIGPDPQDRLLLGNLATHKCVVEVECDRDRCVTLFQPSGWHCGIILVLETLLPVMEARRLITKQERGRAEEALRPLLERLAPSEFDQNELEIARTIAKRLSKGRRQGKR
jgi:hypothetical protein